MGEKLAVVDDPVLTEFELGRYLDCIERSPGLGVLEEYGKIGMSCDRQQTVLRLSEPGKPPAFTIGLNGLLEVR